MNDKKLSANVEKYLEKKAELLKSFGLTEKSDIVFPMYRELPPEVQLAMMIISDHKAEIVSVFNPEESKNE